MVRRRIIGTPFISIDDGVTRQTNKRIRQLIKSSGQNKIDITKRRFRDKINSVPLRNPRTPGAIE